MGEFNLTSKIWFDVEISSIGKGLLGSKTKVGIIRSHDPSPLETNLMRISLLQKNAFIFVAIWSMNSRSTYQVIRNIVFGHVSVDSEARWWGIDKAQSSWIIKGTLNTNNLVFDSGSDVEASSSDVIYWCLNRFKFWFWKNLITKETIRSFWILNLTPAVIPLAL